MTKDAKEAKKTKEATKKKKFGAGVIIGSIIGGVTALLFAPKSGKQTRKDIKSKAKEVTNESKKELKQASKEMDELVRDIRAKAGKLKGQAKTEMDSYLNKAEVLKSKAKEAAWSLKSGDNKDDKVTIDNLLKDVGALKDKALKKLKDLK